MTTSDIKRDWLFWGGIAVGLLVMLVGIFALTQRQIGIAEARLILCSGLGILFGAFGSTAVVNYKGITITGVAAITIVMMYIVVSLTKSQATFGIITGDVKEAQIEVISEVTYLGAIRDRSYEFVVPGSELTRSVFDVYVTFPPNEGGEGEQEIPFLSIDKKHIENFLGSGRRIEWQFHRDEQKLVEVETGELISKFEMPRIRVSETSHVKQKRWVFVGEALAQHPSRSLDEIFVDLGSGIASVRRKARYELASIGPSAVNAMISQLRERGSAYRIRLGVLVGLATMLRNDKSLAHEISKKVSSGDLEIIVEALNDRDRTIRVYAGEFLIDLGDPRVVKPALSLAGSSKSSPDGIYLSVLLLKEVFEHLSPSEKPKTEIKLNKIRPNVGPRTQGLIDSLVGMNTKPIGASIYLEDVEGNRLGRSPWVTVRDKYNSVVFKEEAINYPLKIALKPGSYTVLIYEQGYINRLFELNVSPQVASYSILKVEANKRYNASQTSTDPKKERIQSLRGMVEVSDFGFLIDRHEITNSRYARFLSGFGGSSSWLEEREVYVQIKVSDNQADGRYAAKEGSEDHPVVGVSWHDAVQYCASVGKRLPTEEEWRQAAKGKENRAYPWGSAEPNNELANFASTEGRTTRVGSYPAGSTPEGVMDMIGNVSEWTSSPTYPPEGEFDNRSRTVLGGSWLDSSDILEIDETFRLGANTRNQVVGFRCAK